MWLTAVHCGYKTFIVRICSKFQNISIFSTFFMNYHNILWLFFEFWGEGEHARTNRGIWREKFAKIRIFEPQNPKNHEEHKISGTETSKRNLTLFRPPPSTYFFQVSKRFFIIFRLSYVSTCKADAYFCYESFTILP